MIVLDMFLHFVIQSKAIFPSLSEPDCHFSTVSEGIEESNNPLLTKKFTLLTLISWSDVFVRRGFGKGLNVVLGEG